MNAIHWTYATMVSPTDEELNVAGNNGWEVYWTDGTVYKLKRLYEQ